MKPRSVSCEAASGHSSLLVFLLALLLVSCNLGAPGVDTILEEGRTAYVDARYLEAKERFATALEVAPDRADAHHGFARVAGTLHQYDEALPAFERALELAPGDGRVYEDYAETALWSGVLGGDREQIERSLEVGREGLAVEPDRVPIYATLRLAAAELNEPDRYLDLLDGLASEGIESPVLDIHVFEARIQQADRKTDPAKRSRIVDELRSHIEELEEGFRASPDALSTNELFVLFRAYELLERADEADAVLARLVDRPGSGPYVDRQLYDRVLRTFHRELAGDPEAQLALLREHRDRSAPSWESGTGTYAGIRHLEFLALSSLAHAEGVDETLARRILEAGQDWYRYETWGAASACNQTCQVLADLGALPEERLEFLEQGIAALEQDRPGMVHPGKRGSERKELRGSFSSALLRLKGETLAALDRDEEAE